MVNMTFAGIILNMFRTISRGMRMANRPVPTWPAGVPRITNISVQGDHMVVRYEDGRQVLSTIETIVWNTAGGMNVEDIIDNAKKEQIVFYLSTRVTSQCAGKSLSEDDFSCTF